MNSFEFQSLTGCGCVGASSETAFAYMKKVNDAVECLDADVTAAILPGAPPNAIGQSFLGAWNDFVNGHPAQPEQTTGWRDFVADNSSLLSRIFSTEEIIADIGGYEHRYNELFRKFVEAGGETDCTELTPGPPAASLDEPAEGTLKTILEGAAIIAVGGVALYFLAQSGAFKGKAQ